MMHYYMYFYNNQNQIVYENTGCFDYSTGTVKSKIPLYESSLPIGEYKVKIELME